MGCLFFGDFQFDARNLVFQFRDIVMQFIDRHALKIAGKFGFGLFRRVFIKHRKKISVAGREINFKLLLDFFVNARYTKGVPHFLKMKIPPERYFREHSIYGIYDFNNGE